MSKEYFFEEVERMLLRCKHKGQSVDEALIYLRGAYTSLLRRKKPHFCTDGPLSERCCYEEGGKLYLECPQYKMHVEHCPFCGEKADD